jgi:hypothetical protein
LHPGIFDQPRGIRVFQQPASCPMNGHGRLNLLQNWAKGPGMMRHLIEIIMFSNLAHGML